MSRLKQETESGPKEHPGNMRGDFRGTGGREGGKPAIRLATAEKFPLKGTTAAIESWKHGRHDTATRFRGGDA